MRTLLVSILSVSALAAQDGAPAGAAPAFEAATVKIADPQGDNVRGGFQLEQGRLRVGYVSLRDLMSRAYRVKLAQISGPAWIDTERYDVQGKLPEATPPEQVAPMLRTLIEERFQLKTHRETKEMPVYELVQGKGGPKLDKAAEPTAPARLTMEFNNNLGHANITSATLGNFADMLGRWTDRPVLDKTGLTDKFDISLELSAEELSRSRTSNVVVVRGPGGGTPGAAPEGNPGGSLITSVQKLGLKMEAKRVPMDLIVVDKAEKVPLDN